MYDDGGVSTGSLVYSRISVSEGSLRQRCRRAKTVSQYGRHGPGDDLGRRSRPALYVFNKCCLDFTGDSLDEKIGDGWMVNIHPEDREWSWRSTLLRSAPAMSSRPHPAPAGGWRVSIGAHHRGSTLYGGRRVAGYIAPASISRSCDAHRIKALARQKLESVGVLAGGIAHDFNNLLGGILAEAELSTMQLLQGESPVEGIERIRVAAWRGPRSFAS